MTRLNDTRLPDPVPVRTSCRDFFRHGWKRVHRLVVLNREQRNRCKDLRSALTGLQVSTRGGFAFANLAEIRDALANADRALACSPIRSGARIERLARMLSGQSAFVEHSLETWLNSGESVDAAFRHLRRLAGLSVTGAATGPVDTVWVLAGRLDDEASLRLLNAYADLGSEEAQAVCTPRAVYETLRATQHRLNQADATNGTSTGTQPPSKRYRHVVVSGMWTRLDGADPETVSKLYDRSPYSPYSDLRELVAAAKAL